MVAVALPFCYTGSTKTKNAGENMHTKENAIVLRPMTEADIPALQKMVMDPIITKT